MMRFCILITIATQTPEPEITTQSATGRQPTSYTRNLRGQVSHQRAPAMLPGVTMTPELERTRMHTGGVFFMSGVITGLSRITRLLGCQREQSVYSAVAMVVHLMHNRRCL